MQKEPGRAGGQRPAAWPGGNSKKYAPKPAEEPEQHLLPGDKACTKTKRKGQKRAKKRFWRAKSHGLAAQRGIGGRSVVAASASLGAGLGVHFMPAASRRQRGQPSMHTFCRQNCRMVSG